MAPPKTSLDIYDYDQRMERYCKNIRKRGDLLDSHKKTIFEFDRQLQGEGLSKARRLKYFQTLIQIGKILGISFEDADREAIKRVMTEIDRRGFSGDTKHGYIAQLKRFYKWLRSKDNPNYPDVETPPEVRWLRSNFGNNGNRLPGSLPTDEEVQALCEAATYWRDRAFIEVLDDFGCRPQELLTLHLRDVVFDEYGAVVVVDGKTGQRRVRIVQSAPTLANWISHHPMNGKRDAPLWLKMRQDGEYEGEPLDYGSAKALLKRLCIRAKLRKLKMYDFRHRRATKYAQILTDQQMDEYFGWVHGSKMPRRYVHMSGKDMDPAILKAYGFKVEEREAGLKKPKECNRCHTMNSPLAQFCHRCGLALDIKAALAKDEDTQSMKAEIATLKEDVARHEAFEEYIRKTLAEKKVPA